MSNIPYLEQLSNNEVVTASKAAALAFQVKELADQGGGGSVTYPITIDKGGSGQTTQQAAINALTNSSAATTNQVLTRNSSGNAVFANAPAAALPYKSYVAFLTQAGTSAPVATVAYNDLGGTVIFTRQSPGTYLAILNGAFVANKTICFLRAPSIADYLDGTSYFIDRNDNNSISILSFNYGVSSFADGLLSGLGVEIRVYN